MEELAVASAEAPRFDAAFRAGFAELLAWRRDVRHFRSGEAPDEAMLGELFDLAALAPSVGNCQPTPRPRARAASQNVCSAHTVE